MQDSTHIFIKCQYILPYYKNKIKKKSIICNLFELIDKEDNILFIKNSDEILKMNLDEYIKFSEKEEDCFILFGLRRSFKVKGKYEIINPIGNNICLKNKSTEYIKNNIDNKLWLVFNSSSVNGKDYILNENDIIRFGQKKYEVIKKHLVNAMFNNNNRKNRNLFNIDLKKDQYKIISENAINKKRTVNPKNIKNNNVSLGSTNMNSNEVNAIKENENEKCSICNMKISTKEDPQVILCNCKSFSHFECIKNYIKINLTQRQNKSNNVLTYICKDFNCKDCKCPYPLRFRIPKFDKIYELIDLKFANEDKNYIIFSSLDYIQSDENIIFIHIVELDYNEEIQIGRNINSDIYEKDISITRYQANLLCNNKNGFILKDDDSTFGTMVLNKGNIIMEQKAKEFQIGKFNIKVQIFNNNI